MLGVNLPRLETDPVIPARDWRESMHREVKETIDCYDAQVFLMTQMPVPDTC